MRNERGGREVTVLGKQVVKEEQGTQGSAAKKSETLDMKYSSNKKEEIGREHKQ